MISKFINFAYHGDDRGGLISLEANNNIPFEIKRAYYLFNTKTSVSRGYHAHKKLKQVAVALKGKCTFVLDNGSEREEVLLDSPLKGLYIDSFIWREMHNFSDDCVLLVLADSIYDENDYVRDYIEFLEVSKNG